MRLRGKLHRLNPLADSLSPYRVKGCLFDGSSPLILSSPHSGRFLPSWFRQALRVDELAVRRIEDSHVDRLLATITGTPLLAANWSRAVIDLNRAADEIDPQMFDGQVIDRPRRTERVRRGHGLFPRIGADGRALHSQRLAATTARQLIESVHRPWHQALAKGLAASCRRHGYAVLLDMHSMPGLEGQQPAQIVLGDRYANSAGAPLVDWLHHRLTAAGWRVARNTPYAGGFTTEHHGHPPSGIHAVQIEIDRSLYMNPATLACHSGFAPLAGFLALLIGDLQTDLPSLGLCPHRHALLAKAAE